MSKLRIAVHFYQQHADYAAIRKAVASAEEMGIDAAYNWDHFYPLYGEPDGKHFECWTMLAAWAEATESIDIGPLVTCNSYRNPQLLADMARTVDHISGGRLIFGIGSGWFERDYDKYGYEFGTDVGRLKQLERDLPIIEERWSKLNPAPTRKLPLLIGGGGEKLTLRIAAKHADIWHFFGTPETIAHKSSVLDKWCAEIGRDSDEILRSVGMEDGSFGNAQADEFYDIGVREITLGFSGPDYDLSPVSEWLAWRDEKNA